MQGRYAVSQQLQSRLGLLSALMKRCDLLAIGARVSLRTLILFFFLARNVRNMRSFCCVASCHV